MPAAPGKAVAANCVTSTAPGPGATATSGAPAAATPRNVDWIRALILHEDEHLLVLDKPAGLAVHGGSGISLGAIELLRAARPDCHYLELVHRLLACLRARWPCRYI